MTFLKKKRTYNNFNYKTMKTIEIKNRWTGNLIKSVEVSDFDDNRFNECSAGIHFFISREMAVQYS